MRRFKAFSEVSRWPGYSEALPMTLDLRVGWSIGWPIVSWRRVQQGRSAMKTFFLRTASERHCCDTDGIGPRARSLRAVPLGSFAELSRQKIIVDLQLADLASCWSG